MFLPPGVPAHRLQEEAEYYGIEVAVTSMVSSYTPSSQLFDAADVVGIEVENTALRNRIVARRFFHLFGQEKGTKLLCTLYREFEEAARKGKDGRVRFLERESEYFKLLNNRDACLYLKSYFEFIDGCRLIIKPISNPAGLKFFELTLNIPQPTAFSENLHRLPF